MRIEINSCEDCPFNIDYDPYPASCKHPKAKVESSLYNGKSYSCPLDGEPVIIAIKISGC